MQELGSPYLGRRGLPMDYLTAMEFFGSRQVTCSRGLKAKNV